VLVIGGGITGAAAAWDAAQRGLRVALVEAGDFGAGTSANSLRTIHGGLRHLQRADLPAVRASARERSAFLRNAPRLVRPLPFLVPTYGHGMRGREAMRAALLANDLLTADRNRGLPAAQRIPRGRILPPAEVRALVPGIPGAGVSGGALWTDAQAASSERLVIAILRAAAREGAALANHAAVETLTRGAGGRVTGAACRDHLGGGAFEVRARVTINAAGPGADALLAASGVAPIRVPLLRAWNLVLRRTIVPALAVGAWSGGRYLFLVPWRDRAIVGTGYAPADEPGGGARALFDAAKEAFPWAGLAADDVALVHDGRVPGTTAALWTRPLVRDHAGEGAAGLVSAIGVKFTGGRALAEAAVDLALALLERPRLRARTLTTPLPEAAPPPGPLEEAARAAVRDEMALRLEDAVVRRLDLGAAGPPATADVERVMEAMAPLLGWDAAARDRERAALAAYYAARRL
jgi:glycerol-3-phosphate dehydrogenase